jgi:outer membrane cobalamin receptor
LFSLSGYAQTILDTRLQNLERQSLPQFLTALEARHPINVFYRQEWIDMFDVHESFDGYTLRGMLDELFKETGISYVLMFDYALVITKDPSPAIKREALINDAIIRRKKVEQKTIGSKSRYNPGEKIVLSGVITDLDKGSVITGAEISLDNTIRTQTDGTGRYQLSLTPGEYVLNFHYANYDDQVIDLAIYQNGVINIKLQETPIMLEEIVFSDDALLDRSIGKTDLNIGQIKRAPTFLGEIDVIKQVQSQAGVTTVGEAAAGFNVRGGGVDQNLVLYDDVPIFNTSHAIGFFTAFNSDAISNISFYRGGIPAQYGGRISSVLNITSREGDPHNWTGNGGIGIISSHLTLGGPIKKNKTTALLSTRSSYSDWMLGVIKSNYQDLRRSSVKFYDGSLKLSHKFSDNSKLTLSGYCSNDRFRIADDTTYHWTNIAAALRYDHAFNEKFLSTLSLSYGQYGFKLVEDDPGTAFDLAYHITYPSAKIDFQTEGKHKLLFGLHNTYYEFSPGIMKPTSAGSNARKVIMPVEKSLETALYISKIFDVSNKLQVETGIRYSYYNRFGPATVYRYATGVPREIRNLEDSTVYSKGEISKRYSAAEPRIALRYHLGEKTSLKIGYNRMAQYMHLITNTAAITPTDIWQSANAYFKPQIADQISVGVFRNFADAMFESFVEVYVKNVKNILDFKDGAELILNSNLETALVDALGKSSGVELSASKVKGRLLGTLNYTFSRSLRKTESDFSSEQINGGTFYPSNYDQPHVLNLNWRYGISRRIFFSGNFTYHTGRPVSLPTAAYSVDGVSVSHFSNRNQYRIPDYHRLDLAFIVEGNHKRKKLLDGNWVFSFYNVYARKNAYSVFFRDDGNGVLKPYKLSIIGTVIPSISYSFKF